jgi:hypothetical protein
MNTIRFTFFMLALSGLVLFAGCGDDDGMTTDTGMPDTSTGDADVPDAVADAPMDTMAPEDCVRYCDLLDANCATVQQYASRAECEAYCAGAGWPLGIVDDMAGNTLECRIYHAGVAAMDANTHCPHAGPSGATVCGTVGYRTETADMYTRVDRMGMPAVSTALIGADSKNPYNDDDPAGDAAGTYVPELADSNTALHVALNDDLTGLSLVPCSMTDLIGELPECFGQEIATGSGISVASLVVPDTLQIDGSGTAGFPNGRMLPDQVIDVTLAIILLDMAPAEQDPTTFAALPLNPAANDRSFSTTFPYLAAPHAP